MYVISVQQRWLTKCLQSKDIKLMMKSYLMKNWRRYRAEGIHGVRRFPPKSVAFILPVFAATFGMKTTG